MHASSCISKPLIIVIIIIIIIIIGIGIGLVTLVTLVFLEQKHLAIHRKYLLTISNQNLSVEKIK